MEKNLRRPSERRPGAGTARTGEQEFQPRNHFSRGHPCRRDAVFPPGLPSRPAGHAAAAGKIVCRPHRGQGPFQRFFHLLPADGPDLSHLFLFPSLAKRPAPAAIAAGQKRPAAAPGRRQGGGPASQPRHPALFLAARRAADRRHQQC